MSDYILAGPFTQVVTMAGLPMKGPIADEQLQVIQNAGIWIRDEKIVGVTAYDDLLHQAELHRATIIAVEEPAVALPGFTDAHTHICFAGSRARDYTMRNGGKSYLEIAKAGGGIWDTVQHTRAATPEQLASHTVRLAGEHLLRGTTTLEVKSGYGLNVAEELKMLRAIRQADLHTETDLIATCLAAHMKPKDFDGSETEYLQLIIRELFPLLRSEQLTHRVDAFVEQSAFSPASIAIYFEAAREQGFDITVHADQFTTGGSKTAVAFGAVSADHLEASGETEIRMLAASDTVAVALPGASMGLGCAFMPARKLLDAGGIVVIATDHNPGSAPMGNLLTQAALLGTFQKLSNAEVLAGITFRAAYALRLQDRGILAEGMLADIAVFNTDDHREILYHQGMMLPATVIKRGRKIKKP